MSLTLIIRLILAGLAVAAAAYHWQATSSAYQEGLDAATAACAGRRCRGRAHRRPHRPRGRQKRGRNHESSRRRERPSGPRKPKKD